MSASFITPGHVRAYQMVCSQLYDNVTLTSCFINGEPGVAMRGRRFRAGRPQRQCAVHAEMANLCATLAVLRDVTKKQ